MTETYAMVQPGPQSRRGSSGPMSDAQAIELLSGHPDSDEFIEEYRRCARCNRRMLWRP